MWRRSQDCQVLFTTKRQENLFIVLSEARYWPKLVKCLVSIRVRVLNVLRHLTLFNISAEAATKHTNQSLLLRTLKTFSFQRLFLLILLVFRHLSALKVKYGVGSKCYNKGLSIFASLLKSSFKLCTGYYLKLVLHLLVVFQTIIISLSWNSKYEIQTIICSFLIL